MPKIYSNETLTIVWQAINNEQKLLRKVAEELGSDMPTINLIYQAAKKRFSKTKILRSAGRPVTKETPVVIQKFQRPPAIYSNKSPYGIARLGIK